MHTMLTNRLTTHTTPCQTETANLDDYCFSAVDRCPVNGQSILSALTLVLQLQRCVHVNRVMIHSIENNYYSTKR